MRSVGGIKKRDVWVFSTIVCRFINT